MKAFVFEANKQKAVSIKEDGSNIPPPKVGSWKYVKTIEDIYAKGLTGLDPEVVARDGYQIWPAPKSD